MLFVHFVLQDISQVPLQLPEHPVVQELLQLVPQVVVQEFAQVLPQR
jgi:hypothetical protein